MSLLALLIAQKIITPEPEPEPEPTPAVDPATLTKLRQVATHTAWWRGSGGDAANTYTTISQHTVTQPTKALRIRQGVHGWAGADIGVTGTAHIVVRGQLHTLTWGGQAQVTIPRLEHRTSDPLDESVVVAAGETIHVVWETPPGARFPAGHMQWDTPTKRIITGPYQGNPGQMDNKVLSGAPIGIYGLTDDSAPSIVCMGDSILESGWMRRAAHSVGAAWSDLSQWAEGIPGKGLAGRLDASDPPLYTLGLTEYATNNRSATPQAVAASLVTHWKSAVAGPVGRLGQTTMVPYVAGVSASGSTSLATLDGQVATDKEWRDTLNGWLRDGAPLIDGAPALTGGTGAVRAGSPTHPLIGICDIAAATEVKNSRGELVWRVDKGQASADGIHPTRAGADLMEPTVTQWFRDHI